VFFLKPFERRFDLDLRRLDPSSKQTRRLIIFTNNIPQMSAVADRPALPYYATDSGDVVF
jgi:hypothetical protein